MLVLGVTHKAVQTEVEWLSKNVKGQREGQMRLTLP